jgi:putative transposase
VRRSSPVLSTCFQRALNEGEGRLRPLSAVGGIRPGVLRRVDETINIIYPLFLLEARSRAFSLGFSRGSFPRTTVMSSNFYSEINLHLVWHTKESLPLITNRVEPVLYRYLRQRIINTAGVFVHEIGGIETHVHLAITIPPSLLISDFIGQLKGSSSHEMNQQIGQRDKILQWQNGYGVVSFGTGDLDWVVGYIRRQPEHHAQGKIHERLERITAELP